MAPVFPDAEDSVWTLDEEAGQYYLHHFYRHQPDLNVANPAVRDAIAEIIGYWLAQGLSGFRIDAVPFLIETHGLASDPGRDPHELIREMRAFASRRVGDQMLLGEVNLPPAEMRDYFGAGEGDELQVLFAFTVMQAMYLSFARGNAGPIAAALRELPPIPDACQWAHFVRNHDELTLDKLSRAERRGGVRGVRAGPVDAALRPRPAPAPPADGRRRCGSHAPGIQPAVLAARHAGAVLRRGDRDGREPGHPRAPERARAHAVGGQPAQRRLLDGKAEGAAPAGGRRPRLRAGGGERGRPAPRP